MSKVQEKDSTLLTNLSGSEIAGELDSRLRDLEKNIAVAREFIKLADESYSELRHKWNLLQEEVRNKTQTNTADQAKVAEEKKETRPRSKKRPRTRDTELASLNDSKTPSSIDISSKPETQVKRVKNASRPKKEPGNVSENTDSSGPEKPSQPYRDPGRRRGKTSSRN